MVCGCAPELSRYESSVGKPTPLRFVGWYIGMPGTQTGLLLKQPYDEGAIDNLASEWLCLLKTLSLGPHTSASASPRVLGGSFEFKIDSHCCICFGLFTSFSIKRISLMPNDVRQKAVSCTNG